MRTRWPALVILLGVACLYPVQKYIDSNTTGRATAEESLYLTSGRKIKAMSLGMSGLVADLYWIRTVQYVGQKMIDARRLHADPRSVKLTLLGPLLNIIIEIDPHDIAAYRFAAMFLPDHDSSAAVRLLERGIEANPGEWRLYQDLAFIHWHQGDYARAAETYEQGSNVPGGPYWMKDLAGFMRIKGGSRELARSVYTEYLASDDKNIRAQAEWRLQQLDALDELDSLNRLISAFKNQFNSCPPDLRVLARWTVRMGIPLNSQSDPLDPSGLPYILDSATCTVKFFPGSGFEAR